MLNKQEANINIFKRRGKCLNKLRKMFTAKCIFGYMIPECYIINIQNNFQTISRMPEVVPTT